MLLQYGTLGKLVTYIKQYCVFYELGSSEVSWKITACGGLILTFSDKYETKCCTYIVLLNFTQLFILGFKGTHLCGRKFWKMSSWKKKIWIVLLAHVCVFVSETYLFPVEKIIWLREKRNFVNILFLSAFLQNLFLC